MISIHALLAESDRQNPGEHYVAFRFLSTLSLRRATFCLTLEDRKIQISIHALLAESDALAPEENPTQKNFYPRSPCGERHTSKDTIKTVVNFYPRSPCGERRYHRHRGEDDRQISIHALLAESD